MNISKHGFKMMAGLIVAAMIGVFLTFSMNVICSAMFTKEIGYTAYVYETQTSTEPMAQYEYLYNDTDGDGKDNATDTQRKEYEAKGHIVEIQKQRSSLTGNGKLVFLIATQVISMIMVIAFVGDAPYKQGLKDASLIRSGNLKENKFKGLIIGLIGNIPFFLLAILMVVLSFVTPKFLTVWYAFLNGHFYPMIMTIAGNAGTLGDLNVIKFILIFAIQLMVPVISYIAYILGLKEINITEMLVYKKR